MQNKFFWLIFFGIVFSIQGFSQVWTYDCPGGEEYKSPAYKVSVIQGSDTLQTYVYYSYGLETYTRYSWKMVPEEVKHMDHEGPKSHSTAIFSFSGEVVVRVEVLNGASEISLPLKSAKILPSSYNIPCEIIDGNIIEFEMDRPEKVAVIPNYDEAWEVYAQKGTGHIPIQNWDDNYSLEKDKSTFNGENLPSFLSEGYQNPLFVFVHAPEKRVPDSTSVNVLRLYPGDNITQSKLSQYDTVWFTPGIHDLSGIGDWPWFQTEIKKGQNFYLEGGAYVKAQFIEGKRGSGPSSVTGRGVLSGIGHTWIRSSKNNSICVDVDSIIGITITDRACFGIRAAHYIGDIAMIGAWHGNTDGPDFSDDCLIENCFLQAHDDNVKINHNTRVRHCVLWQGTNAHPIMVKEILRDGMIFGNSLVEDVDIIAYLPGTDWDNPWPQISRAAISVVTAMDLEIRNLTFRDIRIESPYLPRVLNVYNLNTNEVNPGWFNKTSESYHTRIDGITFENITVNSPVIAYRSLIGEGYKNSTKNLNFSNIVINDIVITDDNITDYFEIECENIEELTLNDKLINVSCDTISEPILVYGVSVGECPDFILETGYNHQLIANVAPAEAVNRSVIWTSSNPVIATVDVNGMVSAISQGTTEIIVKTNDGGYTAVCRIGIRSSEIAVTGVKINGCPVEPLPVDSTVQLMAQVIPEDAGDLNVIWNSSDTTIATVDAGGLVTAVSKGTATIEITTHEGGYTNNCIIDVNSTSSLDDRFVAKPEVVLYPNPVFNILHFSFAKKSLHREVQIFNSFGRLLYKDEAPELLKTISVESLHAKGIIQVRIISEEKMETHKVLIK